MGKDNNKHILSALGDLGIILTFTLFPTITSFIGALITSTTDKFYQNFYLSGEFLLYAVALLSSSYVILDFYKAKQKTLWLILLLLFSVCYAIASFAISNGKNVNKSFMLWASFIEMGFAVIASFYSQYIQHQNVPDIRTTRENEQYKIENALK